MDGSSLFYLHRLASAGTFVPSFIALPSTEKWYSCPSGSVNTKCSLATKAVLSLSSLIVSGDLSCSCFFFNDFKLCNGDHSKAVIGGNFFGIVLSKLRFFKSHNSNGAPRNETMKYCFKCETRIISIGGSSDLCDRKATDLPVRISVWFNSFRTKLDDPPDKL